MSEEFICYYLITHKFFTQAPVCGTLAHFSPPCMTVLALWCGAHQRALRAILCCLPRTGLPASCSSARLVLWQRWQPRALTALCLPDRAACLQLSAERAGPLRFELLLNPKA